MARFSMFRRSEKYGLKQHEMTIQTCFKLNASISLTANRKNTFSNKNENFYFPYNLFVDSGFLIKKWTVKQIAFIS